MDVLNVNSDISELLKIIKSKIVKNMMPLHVSNVFTHFTQIKLNVNQLIFLDVIDIPKQKINVNSVILNSIYQLQVTNAKP